MSARSLHRPTSLYSPSLLLLPFFLSLPFFFCLDRLPMLTSQNSENRIQATLISFFRMIKEGGFPLTKNVLGGVHIQRQSLIGQERLKEGRKHSGGD